MGFFGQPGHSHFSGANHDYLRALAQNLFNILFPYFMAFAAPPKFNFIIQPNLNIMIIGLAINLHKAEIIFLYHTHIITKKPAKNIYQRAFKASLFY